MRSAGKGKGPRSTATAPRWRVEAADCLDHLPSLPAESVDAVITDPPYGIGVNRERWDSATIREVAAHSSGGRLGPGEAFEVWCRLWATECLRVMKPGAFILAFGSPRTYHRLACGLEDAGFEIRDTLMWLYGTGMSKSRRYPGGRATTLKPAFEPIVLARRPLSDTTEETIDRYGTGALCIEECETNGRHPANVIAGHAPECDGDGCVADCAAALVDEGADRARARSGSCTPPSRFLYCPKVSRAERDAGCERLPKRALDLFPNADRDPRRDSPTHNPHPTVKPLELMRWLVRLACPPDGLVLDPFCGSGTTGAAAAIEGRCFLGIEMEPHYVEIAAARIVHWEAEDREPKAEAAAFFEESASERVGECETAALHLAPESIESLALRVAELIRPEEQPHPAGMPQRMLSAAEVSEWWGVRRRWVYEHADRLGARRLGSGSRPRLRFDPDEVAERLGAPVPRPPVLPDGRGLPSIAGNRQSGSLYARRRAIVAGQEQGTAGRRANAPGPAPKKVLRRDTKPSPAGLSRRPFAAGNGR